MAKKEHKKSNGAGKFFLGAAVGAVGGTVAGILTAPKSGKATRADIKRGGKKAINATKKQVGKIASSVKHKKASTKKA